MPFTVAPEEKAELLCTFAALLLHDEKLKIDGDNIQKLITAAGAQIEPYWPKLFANMLANQKIGDLLVSAAAPAAGGGGGGGGEAAAAPAAGKAGKDDKKADKKGGDKKGDKKADKKEKEKPAEAAPAEEEGDGNLGFSLFD